MTDRKEIAKVHHISEKDVNCGNCKYAIEPEILIRCFIWDQMMTKDEYCSEFLPVVKITTSILGRKEETNENHY